MHRENLTRPFIPAAWLSWWESYLTSSILVAKEELNSNTFKRRLKDEILSLSTHYQARGSMTPWTEPWKELSYLCYYMPLNQLRLWAVLNRLVSRGLLFDSQHLVEFGSGPGTSEWAKQHHAFFINRWTSYLGIETSAQARKIHRTWQSACTLKEGTTSSCFGLNELWQNQLDPSNCGLILQTSLNELDQTPAWFFDCREILVIEAGHRLKSRGLLQFRQDALKRGFSVWAPCTHQQNCPMLATKTDWCHDRFDLLPDDLPETLTELWPFERTDLSFSYLYFRKTEPSPAGQEARLVGDPLVEKGKTRQQICRSDKREFVSWLHRNRKQSAFQRGDLLKMDSISFNEKGNELRISEG